MARNTIEASSNMLVICIVCIGSLFLFIPSANAQTCFELPPTSSCGTEFAGYAVQADPVYFPDLTSFNNFIENSFDNRKLILMWCGGYRLHSVKTFTYLRSDTQIAALIANALVVKQGCSAGSAVNSRASTVQYLVSFWYGILV